MNLLAIDTATEACSVALWLDGHIEQRHEVVGRDHTRCLLAMVESLLAEAGVHRRQLDALVCGVGPGSFAGIRIGLSYVKGLALGLDLPVVQVSSLAAIAQGALISGATRVAAAIDARMDEVYLGLFQIGADGRVQALRPAQVVRPADARSGLPEGERSLPWQAAGSGWGSYHDALEAALELKLIGVDAAALPQAGHALQLALPVFRAGQAQSGERLEPIYLRERVALNLQEQAIARARDRR